MMDALDGLISVRPPARRPVPMSDSPRTFDRPANGLAEQRRTGRKQSADNLRPDLGQQLQL